MYMPILGEGTVARHDRGSCTGGWAWKHHSQRFPPRKWQAETRIAVTQAGRKHVGEIADSDTSA